MAHQCRIVSSPRDSQRRAQNDTSSLRALFDGWLAYLAFRGVALHGEMVQTHHLAQIVYTRPR